MHTHAFTHSHLNVHRKKFGKIHVKQLPDHSLEIPLVLQKDHPALSLKSSGWLWRVPSEEPCAGTTGMPPASQKSPTGAYRLVSRTSLLHHQIAGKRPHQGLLFPAP